MVLQRKIYIKINILIRRNFRKGLKLLMIKRTGLGMMSNDINYYLSCLKSYCF